MAIIFKNGLNVQGDWITREEFEQYKWEAWNNLFVTKPIYTDNTLMGDLTRNNPLRVVGVDPPTPGGDSYWDYRQDGMAGWLIAPAVLHNTFQVNATTDDYATSASIIVEAPHGSSERHMMSFMMHSPTEDYAIQFYNRRIQTSGLDSVPIQYGQMGGYIPTAKDVRTYMRAITLGDYTPSPGPSDTITLTYTDEFFQHERLEIKQVYTDGTTCNGKGTKTSPITVIGGGGGGGDTYWQNSSGNLKNVGTATSLTLDASVIKAANANAVVWATADAEIPTAADVKTYVSSIAPSPSGGYWTLASGTLSSDTIAGQILLDAPLVNRRNAVAIDFSDDSKGSYLPSVSDIKTYVSSLPATASRTDGLTLKGSGTEADPTALRRVYTDGTTIDGYGTEADPIKFIGTSGVTGVVDNDTLTGQGTSSFPWKLNKIYVDNTLTGHGTQAMPLGVRGGGSGGDSYWYYDENVDTLYNIDKNSKVEIRQPAIDWDTSSADRAVCVRDVKSYNPRWQYDKDEHSLTAPAGINQFWVDADTAHLMVVGGADPDVSIALNETYKYTFFGRAINWNQDVHAVPNVGDIKARYDGSLMWSQVGTTELRNNIEVDMVTINAKGMRGIADYRPIDWTTTDAHYFPTVGDVKAYVSSLKGEWTFTSGELKNPVKATAITLNASVLRADNNVAVDWAEASSASMIPTVADIKTYVSAITAGTMVADETSLTGEGTSSQPAKIKEVFTDNNTVSGKGTLGDMIKLRKVFVDSTLDGMGNSDQNPLKVAPWVMKTKINVCEVEVIRNQGVYTRMMCYAKGDYSTTVLYLKGKNLDSVNGYYSDPTIVCEDEMGRKNGAATYNSALDVTTWKCYLYDERNGDNTGMAYIGSTAYVNDMKNNFFGTIVTSFFYKS